MPIVNQLIFKLETSNPGSTINKVLKTGTNLAVTKEKTKDTYRVVRRRQRGDVYTTIIKKIKNKLITKSVHEEHRFGLINILFRNDGTRVFNIRPCDVRGRASKQNGGFFKTSIEEYVLAKGNEVSQEIELKSHMKKIRRNDRYRLHDRNFTEKDEFMYMEADEKRGYI